jgi:endonuclease YncB( thermonuclease family)
MKKLSILALALIAAGAANAAGSSGADEYNEQNRSEFTSTLTRAQVQAEYAEAVESGQLYQNGEWNTDFAVNQQAGSPRDVGAVRAEAIYAARNHPQDLA